jgi:ribonucleoside-diphosphate reductase alpha chain
MSKYYIDYNRNKNFTTFGLTTLKDRYLSLKSNTSNEKEDPQEMFARIASAYADDIEHEVRLYNYMSNFWFMPATPILTNAGTTRGLPISCFLNEVQDNINGIAKTYNENIYLASSGGGIGTNWSNVRGIGEQIVNKGNSSGIMPFLKVADSMSLAISQGGIRRGSSAQYLHISHPEIEEFIDVRRPTGDNNRRSLNIHHGIVIPDEFMQKVKNGEMWQLKSPKTGKIVSEVSAQELWIKILTARVETGEPYLLFIDNVNKYTPEHHKKLGLSVKTSNLCSEITLPTGIDHLGKERTAVCCLSSVNLIHYKDWENDINFIPDIMRFLDNVLEDFINKAPNEIERAKYSAMRERSVGLGVMGFHSFLQSQNVPFEGVMAQSWNKRIFKHLKTECDKISKKLAIEKGSCPDAKDAGIIERFSYKIAIAPTANISNICGEASPGIEPSAANVFTQKTLSGSFTIKNKYLQNLLQSKGYNTEEIWSSIATQEGSVQHLDFLTPIEKEVFKTAFELNQEWIIEHAADRTPFVCQAQSVNLFLLSDVSKKVLNAIHFNAWKKGVKSLYYCRSRSKQRADKVSQKITTNNLNINENKYEECLACQ